MIYKKFFLAGILLCANVGVLFGSLPQSRPPSARKCERIASVQPTSGGKLDRELPVFSSRRTDNQFVQLALAFEAGVNESINASGNSEDPFRFIGSDRVLNRPLSAAVNLGPSAHRNSFRQQQDDFFADTSDDEGAAHDALEDSVTSSIRRQQPIKKHLEMVLLARKTARDFQPTSTVDSKKRNLQVRTIVGTNGSERVMLLPVDHPVFIPAWDHRVAMSQEDRQGQRKFKKTARRAQSSQSSNSDGDVDSDGDFLNNSSSSATSMTTHAGADGNEF